MKCPMCKSEMEKGFISGPIWGKGEPIGKGFAEALSLGGKYVNSYRCPKCGKVELTTEVK